MVLRQPEKHGLDSAVSLGTRLGFSWNPAKLQAVQVQVQVRVQNQFCYCYLSYVYRALCLLDSTRNKKRDEYGIDCRRNTRLLKGETGN